MFIVYEGEIQVDHIKYKNTINVSKLKVGNIFAPQAIISN
jgi:hypothetical protein